MDDGIQVWVGEVLVIDNWQLNDMGFSEGYVKMKADKTYNFKVEYFNALNEGEITLSWELPQPEDQGWFASWWAGDQTKIISPQYFFHPPLEEEPTVATVKTEPIPKANTIEKKTIITPIPKKVEQKTYQQYLPKNVAFGQAKVG